MISVPSKTSTLHIYIDSVIFLKINMLLNQYQTFFFLSKLRKINKLPQSHLYILYSLFFTQLLHTELCRRKVFPGYSKTECTRLSETSLVWETTSWFLRILGFNWRDPELILPLYTPLSLHSVSKLKTYTLQPLYNKF